MGEGKVARKLGRFQFSLRFVLWLTVVIAVVCAVFFRLSPTRAQQVVIVSILFCPAVGTVVARTCPGTTLRKACLVAVAISIAAFVLAWGWTILHKYPSSGRTVLWVVACALWCPQVAILLAIADRFSERRRGADPTTPGTMPADGRQMGVGVVKAALALLACVWLCVYVSVYVCLSVKGRYEPAGWGLGGPKWYSWAPSGFVDDLEWNGRMMLEFGPLYYLDCQFWHRNDDCESGKYPVNWAVPDVGNNNQPRVPPSARPDE